MQRQTEFNMLDERKETERAIECPLQNRVPIAGFDGRFDKRIPLPSDRDDKASLTQNCGVLLELPVNGLGSIMKNIKIV